MEQMLLLNFVTEKFGHIIILTLESRAQL